MTRSDLRQCWIRAGEPLVRHSLVPADQEQGWRRALCGAEAFGWRCLDDIADSAAAACPTCVELSGRRSHG